MTALEMSKVADSLTQIVRCMKDSQQELSMRIVESLVRSNLPFLSPGFADSVTDSDIAHIIAMIEMHCPFSSDSSDICAEKPDGEDWFFQKSGVCPRPCFDRYMKLLQSNPSFEKQKALTIQKNAERILAHCGNPDASDEKRYGLILGDVQSGKTANFLALSALAYDYGYKHVVILSGLTELLRGQTQRRVEAALVGNSSKEGNPQVGVGVFSETGKERFVVPLTTMAKDFPKSLNTVTWETDTSKPLVSVVKKNTATLDNFDTFVKKQNVGAILLIDDEADQASINIKSEDSPAAINSRIRNIVKHANNITYLACTATPFANILIGTEESPEHKNGSDLFPRDFILKLDKGNSGLDYCGADFFFGKDGAYELLSTDEENTFYTIGSKTTRIEDIPDSLCKVVLCFWLGCVVRTLRNDGTKHRSMLVNTSVRTVLHRQIHDELSDYCDSLLAFAEEVEGCDIEDFRDYDSLTKPGKILETMYAEERMFEQARKEFTFEQIRAHLLDEIKQFRVEVFNADSKGRSTSKFSYEKYAEKGARLIAVGGLVLSRGLTLEGLMCSYFCRSATAYDTLLQMGRWFGYRNGYRDLCRVWLYPNRLTAFENVMEAVADLDEQLSALIKSGSKPRDFGLMVRKSPKIFETRSFLVTARDKAQKATPLRMVTCYDGYYPDTHAIFCDKTRSDANTTTFYKWIESLLAHGATIQETSLGTAPKPMIKNIVKEEIVNFIGALHIPIKSFAVSTIADYIQNDSEHPFWDIVIAGVEKPQDAERKMDFFGKQIGVGTRRMELDEEDPTVLHVDRGNNRVLIPGHLKYGLTEAQFVEAKQEAVAAGRKIPNQADLLGVEGRNPLLLVYPLSFKSEEKITLEFGNFVLAFALGFPGKKGLGVAHEYLINTQKLKQLCNARAREMADDEAEEKDTEQ